MAGAGSGSGRLIWVSPHVNSAHSRAVWYPWLWSIFICFLSASTLPAGLLIITNIWITPRTVLRYVINLWFLVQENAIALRQLAAAFGFVAGDALSFGSEAGFFRITGRRRGSGERHWLYIHQQRLWSAAASGSFDLKRSVQVI